jgi:hypothetical protein
MTRLIFFGRRKVPQFRDQLTRVRRVGDNQVEELNVITTADWYLGYDC